ncbi:MAG: hypothetical protein IPI60_14830 [Saprospiraceae bacterium]|nr:hypothetical protein [Saprospiraceae bacterium]
MKQPITSLENYELRSFALHSHVSVSVSVVAGSYWKHGCVRNSREKF